MGRTKISTLVGVACCTLAVGWILLTLLSRSGTHLGPVQWIMTPVLLALAVVVIWLANAVRLFLGGKRPALDPLRAARTAALSKAAALGGSIMAGWYASQLVLAFANIEIEAQQGRAWRAGAACLAAIVLAIAGLVGERCCQLPPPADGADSAIRENGAHD